MKKLTFLFIAFVGSSAIANELPSDQCNEVFLSCPTQSFTVEGRALFMKLTGSQLHYAAEATTCPVTSPSWNIYDIKTNYHPGFDVGVGYFFPCSSTNLTLNWQHLHAKDSTSRSTDKENMIGPIFEIGPDAVFYKTAKGKVHFQFDEIYLDAGIFVNFGDYFETRFYAGINSARIKQTVQTYFSSTHKIVSKNIASPSTYLGMGPQIGIDLAYSLPAGFSLAGNASASLLVGSLKNETTYKSYSPFLKKLGMCSPNIQKTKTHHRTQVVPALEGRLGIGYSRKMCNFAFRLEVGYEAKVYLNAVQSTDIGSQTPSPPVSSDTIGVYARSFQRNTSNFALAGPYVSLSIDF